MGKDNLVKLDTSVKKNFTESPVFKYAKGFIVSTVHFIIINIMFIVSVFSFDIKVLGFSLFVCIGLIIANIIVHNCPLTEIEEEVWGDSVVDFFNRYFPINYNSNRKFEVQLQYIFICASIIGTKILFYLVKNDLKNYMDIKYT
jgi:hypothetical protein